jgi:hypothetical protein
VGLVLVLAYSNLYPATSRLFGSHPVFQNPLATANDHTRVIV